VVKRVYRIREKKVGRTVAYFITLPSEVARVWLQISSYVVIERDPLDPYALRVRLVKLGDVK
jgi:hypothetical protein